MLLEVHKRLFEKHGLNEQHFDLVVGHLVASLEAYQVSKALLEGSCSNCLAFAGRLLRGSGQVW